MAEPPARAAAAPPAADATAPADLRTVRALLDEALVALPRVKDPAFALRPAAEALAGALGACYRALAAAVDQPPAFPRAASELTAACRAALAVLEGNPSRDEAALQAAACAAKVVEALAQGAAGRSFSPLELPRPGRGEEKASRDEPRTLDPARGLFPPAVPLTPPAPELIRPGPPPPPPVEAPPAEEAPPGDPATLDALLAAAEAEATAADADLPEEPAATPPPRPPPATEAEAEREIFGTALSRDEVLFARARSFLEDLAMMGLMRQPDPGDLWSELAPVEARLLARVDAILACGEAVLPRLVALLDDRPIPDPDLLWGLVFLFGSVAGDDAADQALRLVRTAPLADPAVLDAVADALTHAPSPQLERRVRAWLGMGDPTLLRLALRVLGRRGALTAPEAFAASRQAPVEIVREAAAALVAAPGPLDPQGLARLLSHEDGAVAACAIEASIRHGRPEGLALASRLTASGRGHLAEAAVYVGIAAGPAGLQVLEEASRLDASPALVEGAGWYGSAELVPWLLELLRRGEKGAVAALQRITGASLTEDDPDPEYDPEERPFLGPPRPPPLAPVLTADPDAWSAWWEKHGEAAQARTRWRHGHPWTPRDCLWELEDAPASPGERRLAHLELAARTGQRLPFDAAAFVARQRREIEAWRAFVEGGGAGRGQGGWPSTLGR